MSFSSRTTGQTPATGALTGVTLNPTGAVLPAVVLLLTNKDTASTTSVTSDKEGRFSFFLLPPGGYGLQASRTGFDTLITTPTINVGVTETVSVELHLRLATVFHSVEVSAQLTMVQANSSSLGRIINAPAVSSLPLVTRNFAQIASLSPGVTTGVYNAGELGLGGTALSQIAQSNDGIFVHGARSYDNDFLIDGISVSDVQGSAAGSGGIPIPNPPLKNSRSRRDSTMQSMGAMAAPA